MTVDGCQDADYLDATAAGAGRTITWNIFVTETPQRCLKVLAGQTVHWSGDLSEHPLASDEGTTPNPIDAHDGAGNVTFTQPGTFGWRCLIHSQMIGSVMVVSPPPPAVPAAGAGAVGLLVALLLGFGLVTRLRRRSTLRLLRGRAT